MPSKLASIPSSISAAHGVLHAPLELHHNGIKSHQTMVSHGLVSFFPSLVFPSFFHLVLIFSFYFVFLFHIYCSLSITLCFSIDSMQLWDYKSVLHSICRFPCLLWFTSFTSFPLHFNTILLLPLCFLSFLFGDSCLESTVRWKLWVVFGFNFYRSSYVLCLVHAFFYMFLQFSTVYNHFLHLLEWNRAKLHSKT